MAQCARCGSPKLTERACPRCGRYGSVPEDAQFEGQNPNVPAQGGSVYRAGDVHAAEPPPLVGTLGFDTADEIGPAFNMRDWVRDAVQAKGAKMVGGGIGLGQADIDIELEGHRYNISIRALKKR